MIPACLPPREVSRPVQGSAHGRERMLDALAQHPAARHRILVSNPAKLYGFPN
jgi:predicted TIM-barrel fold metal-dependent hydrolase